jgi:hypothetical protein
VHPEAKVLQTELRKILPVNCVGVKIVFLQAFSESMPLFVFAPDKAGAEKNRRRNNRRDYVNRNVTTVALHVASVPKLHGELLV